MNLLTSHQQHRWGQAGVGMAAALLTAVLFWPMLVHPNDHFVTAGGDAIQSYYVTAFYALHDVGNHFSGMNYPKGEHINYLNMQPLLAIMMGWLQRHGVPTGRYTVAITNLLALSSLVITPVVLYAILRRTRLPVLYAGVLALIIGFMAPQVLRLDSHLSLSYAWFVPMLWYLLIRIQEAPRAWRWYAWFVLAALLMGAVMPYYLAVGGFFALGHVLVLAWQEPRWRPWLGRLVLVALLPLLLYRAYLWATDPVTDRPPNPYGLLVYVARPATIFTPAIGPLHEWWQQHWPNEHQGEAYEGTAYVGLVVGAALAVSVLLSVVALARHRRWRRLGRPALPLHLRTGLWAGTLLLLFSFGIPFIWHRFDWVTDHAGPVKQFRSLGRFTWSFYYVATVYTAYCLYRLTRYLRRRPRLAPLATVGLPVLLLLWATDAGLQVAAKAKQITADTGADDFLNPHANLAARLTWTGRRASEFQAILPLPYFNIGTDKVDLGGGGQTTYQAYSTAAVTGLPLLASYIPRGSVSQAMLHVQLLSSPLVPKELLAQFPNNKPLLLVVTSDGLSESEQRLVRLSHRILEAPEGMLYELPIAALAATSRVRERARADSLWPTLPAGPAGRRATTPAGVLYSGFDHAADRRGRLAAGAFYEPKNTFSTLYEGPLPLPADTGRYEAAAWINSKMAYGFGNMQIDLYDAQNQRIDHQTADGRLITEVLGDWVRIAVPFRRTPQAVRMRVLYDNHDLLADDLLIRPLNTDVYWHDAQGNWVLNGWPLGPAGR